MKTPEQKALEERAYGKPIRFHTRHWWILEWIDEQPGKNRADKVWNIIHNAYKQHYLDKAHKAKAAFFSATTFQDRMDCLCKAAEYYGRAENNEQYEFVRELMGGLMERGSVNNDNN